MIRREEEETWEDGEEDMLGEDGDQTLKYR